MEKDSRIMVAAEIAAVLRVSTSQAYKIIRQLNDELKQQGYYTSQGRVPREYFNKRYCI